MKWGTSQGTKTIPKGVELPEAHLAQRRILDRLYRRGWITDVNGHPFDQRYSTHAQANPEPPAPAPAPEPPAPPPVKLEEPMAVTIEADPKAELAKMKRAELDKVAEECGLKPAEYSNKEELVEAILKAGE
jgi:hypothetical protein